MKVPAPVLKLNGYQLMELNRQRYEVYRRLRLDSSIKRKNPRRFIMLKRAKRLSGHPQLNILKSAIKMKSNSFYEIYVSSRMLKEMLK